MKSCQDDLQLPFICMSLLEQCKVKNFFKRKILKWLRLYLVSVGSFWSLLKYFQAIFRLLSSGMFGKYRNNIRVLNIIKVFIVLYGKLFCPNSEKSCKNFGDFFRSIFNHVNVKKCMLSLYWEKKILLASEALQTLAWS